MLSDRDMNIFKEEGKKKFYILRNIKFLFATNPSQSITVQTLLVKIYLLIVLLHTRTERKKRDFLLKAAIKKLGS